MGYHLRKIEKRQVGTIEKILEEVEEYQDAMEQGCEIMALVELSDIYGALQLVAEKHGTSMDALRKMSSITRRAFEDGSRTNPSSQNNPDIADIVIHFLCVENSIIETPYESNGVTITYTPTGMHTTCNQYDCKIKNKRLAIHRLAVMLSDQRQREETEFQIMAKKGF